VLASDRAIPPPYADGFVYLEGTVSNVTQDNMSANIAEGNIVSTPADLAHWIRRLINGQAGPNAASVAAMETATTQSGTSKYGLGLFYVPGLGYGHNGAHQGYLSLMLYDPTADVGVVMYFNIWDESTGNLSSDQLQLLTTIAADARRAAGY
jgi:D-alanyl-D-alanine carboxypeptidase